VDIVDAERDEPLPQLIGGDRQEQDADVGAAEIDVVPEPEFDNETPLTYRRSASTSELQVPAFSSGLRVARAPAPASIFRTFRFSRKNCANFCHQPTSIVIRAT
jgi:hypothetical protein